MTPEQYIEQLGNRYIDEKPMPITSCSVRVMRSFDYCHFEIVIGATADENHGPLSTADVDNLRKEAARLADKSVEQYKTAKIAAENRTRAIRDKAYRQKEFERIDAIQESDRTTDEMVEWKLYKEYLFHASRSYDYQDDWQDYPDPDDV